MTEITAIEKFKVVCKDVVADYHNTHKAEGEAAITPEKVLLLKAEDISEAEQLYAIACTDPDDECMYQVVYDIPLDELSIDVFKHSETKIFCGKKPAKVFVALDPEKETDEIVADYNKAKVVAENHYMGPVEVMEYDYTVEDLTSLGVFGEALKMLSRADIAYFPVGWEESCVCRFFHGAAQCEGKQIIEG